MLPNILLGLNIVLLLVLSVSVASKPTKGFRNRRLGDVDPRGFPDHKPLKQFNIRNHKKRVEVQTYPHPSGKPYPNVPMPAQEDAVMPAPKVGIPVALPGLPVVPPISTPLPGLPVQPISNPAFSIPSTPTFPTSLPNVMSPVSTVIIPTVPTGKAPVVVIPSGAPPGIVPLPIGIPSIVQGTTAASLPTQTKGSILGNLPLGFTNIGDTVPIPVPGILGNNQLGSVQTNGAANTPIAPVGGGNLVSINTGTGTPDGISGSTVSGTADSAFDINKLLGSINSLKQRSVDSNPAATVKLPTMSDSDSFPASGTTGLDSSGNAITIPANVIVGTPFDEDIKISNRRGEMSDTDGGSGL